MANQSLLNIYLKKNGDIKYYTNYRSAWNAANRLNENATDGLWFFEADINGWYLFFDKQ